MVGAIEKEIEKELLPKLNQAEKLLEKKSLKPHLMDVLITSSYLIARMILSI